jgi:capsular exopolysaccharide synthesis family protein
MSKLIKENDSKSAASEAYRMLRTNIQFSSISREIRVVAVTSSIPGEGKSTTACNYALSLTETGKKVLLIDCDLRKPTIHRKFKISNATGLTNILLGEATAESTICLAAGGLSVLSAGTLPPNPAEVVGSQRMKDFLHEMEKQYDYIVIDTPPLLAVADGQVISSISDGVLLVVESKKTPKDSVLKSKELLTNVHANIIGVILNKCELSNKKGYGYYYGYGQENEDKKTSMHKKRSRK